MSGESQGQGTGAGSGAGEDDSTVCCTYTVAELRSGVTIRPGPPVRITVSDLHGSFVHLLVQDAQGKAQAGATVRVYHAGALVATGKTDASGVVNIAGLPPADSYEVEVDGHSAEMSDATADGEQSEAG